MRSGWSIKCPTCGHSEDGIEDGLHGCPVCRANGTTSAMLVDYDPLPPYRGNDPKGVGIWANWGDWLPSAIATAETSGSKVGRLSISHLICRGIICTHARKGQLAS